MRNRRQLFTGLMVVALLATTAACTDDGDEGGAPGSTAAPAVHAAPPAEPLGADDAARLEAQLDENPGCEVLDERACLLPFPSDHFTSLDDSTDSGRRIAFTSEVMPSNAGGVAVDPAGWLGNDGFSPGTPMLTHLPTVDLQVSGAPTIGRIDLSMEPDSPVVVLDLVTGERVPAWAELDASTDDDANRVLIIRAARNLIEGHEHAVALRTLLDGDGARIEAPLGFRVYRDNLTTELEPIEQRRAAHEALFGSLGDAGIARDDLVLAWTFTVASARNLSERLLAMRDDALGGYGDDGAPAFTITDVVRAPDDSVRDGIDRLVYGTFTVPLYLEGDGAPGSAMHDTDGDWIPERNGEREAAFACQVPEASLTGPTGGVVYGHGLLGSHAEVRSSHVSALAAQANLVYCATDWWGMASEDLPNAIAILGDLGRFSTLADRSQQGILNTVLLGRLLRSPDGFLTHEAFAGEDAPVLDGEVYYDGNSQGGIMGGAATAISTEWTKAVLGVPGMNYSTLLRRSVDFVGKEEDDLGFEDVLIPSYPDPVDQNLGYGLIQMLWDRGETNGYAAHLTDDPYPNTPEHTVILHVAFGDHQVATVTTEVLARTAGIGLRAPALADGRHPDGQPYFGLDQITEFPTERSLLVYWDSGTLPVPAHNLTVIESEAWLDACSADRSAIPCVDPHEDPRRQIAAIEQKAAFFRPDGRIIDPCGGAPCAATPRSQL